MASRETMRVGKRGTVVIPVSLRERFGIEEGGFLVAEPRPDGILLRAATVVPIENYTPERKAEFLLSNAVNAKDFARAREEVKKLGLDPAKIRRRRPRRT
jgi:AbrB family looped-hinge helix DNA binding protein